MTAPTNIKVGAAGFNSASTSGAVTHGIGAQNNVLMVVHVFIENNSTGTAPNVSSIVDDVGNTWHQFINHTQTELHANSPGPTNDTSVRMEVWYAYGRVTNGGSFTVTLSASVDGFTYQFHAWTGADHAHPIELASIAFAHTDTSADCTTTTTSTATNVALVAFAARAANANQGPPFFNTGGTADVLNSASDFSSTNNIRTYSYAKTSTSGFSSQVAGYSTALTNGPQANQELVTYIISADPAPGALAKDGQATANTQFGNTISATLTTTKTDDIIVAMIQAEMVTGSTPASVSTITNTAGLTWHLRKRFNWTGGRHTNPQTLEIWWAHAPSALTGDTITVTFDRTFDGSTMIVIGVNNADLTNPWDSNGSLPATNSDVTGSLTSPTVTGVSTSAPDTFTIAVWATAESASTTVSAPDQFLNIAFVINNTPTDWAWIEGAYSASSSQLNNQTITFAPTENFWGMVVDALVQSGESGDIWHSTELPDTFSAVGYPGEFGAHGFMDAVEPRDGVAFQVAVAPVAFLSATEAPDTFSAFVKLPQNLAWHSNEAPDRFSAAGIGLGEDGTFISTEAPDVFTATGTTPISGQWVSTEAPDRFRALTPGVTNSKKRRIFFVT